MKRKGNLYENICKIDNIESIECLNQGTFNYADESMKTAVFDIQLQIVYRED